MQCGTDGLLTTIFGGKIINRIIPACPNKQALFQ